MREKSFDMRHFRVSTYPKEPFLGRRGRSGWKKMKETAPTEAVGCIVDGGQEAKTAILDPLWYADVGREAKKEIVAQSAERVERHGQTYTKSVPAVRRGQEDGDLFERRGPHMSRLRV